MNSVTALMTSHIYEPLKVRTCTSVNLAFVTFTVDTPVPTIRLTPTVGGAGADDPTFFDQGGFTCKQWEGYNCAARCSSLSCSQPPFATNLQAVGGVQLR
jgi:hypothetical protein